MNKNFVYMDYNATTPLRKEVKDEIIADLEIYANASSMHESGRIAKARIEEARSNIAKLVNIQDPTDIIFTSGGSESNNTVFSTMFYEGRKSNRRGIVTTSIEHPCVMNAAKWLADEGFPVTFLKVDSYGRVDMEQLKSVVNENTLLVSIMMANNEIGTIQDIKAIGKIVKAKGAYFHTDATQAVGKIPVDVEDLGVDYLTMSCHKLYGPKGIGALFIRKKAPFVPFVRGGHQEEGRRAGTYNNLGILGFGLAAKLAKEELASYESRLRALRNRLRDGITSSVPNVKINGDPENVLPNTLDVSFPGAEGESILLSLDLEGIRASTGSACASGSLEPSHVLMATGVDAELAHGSIRFSMGRDTTAEDVDYVISKIGPIIARLRKISTRSF